MPTTGNRVQLVEKAGNFFETEDVHSLYIIWAPMHNDNSGFILLFVLHEKMADFKTPRIRILARIRAKGLQRTLYLQRRFFQTY